jgi:transcriptional regulator GlxA family with amidase domain
MATPATAGSPSQKLPELAKTRPLVVGILIFPNVEVLDFCGPFEVLSVCRLGDLHQDDNVTKSPFVVHLIAKSKDPVVTVGGMQVLPHLTIDDIMENDIVLDILIVPGGVGTRALRQDAKVLEFVRQQAIRVHIVASVCTGAIVLAEAGPTVVPIGSTITTHWQAVDTLQTWYPHLIIDKIHSVTKNDTGTLYTSAGISAGIDMRFRLITDIFGEDTARNTAKRMEYSFPETYQRRIEF